MKRRISIPTRLALLVLLLAVQSVCLAHQVDHIVGAGDETCAICTVGAQVGHAAVDSQALDIPLSDSLSVETGTVQAVRDFSPRLQKARAPPSFASVR